MSDNVKRRMVWLCHGCDECDGPCPQVRPCDSPSSTGAWVVLAADFDRLRDERDRAVDALREIAASDVPVNALDPHRNVRVAQAALAAADRDEPDEECADRPLCCGCDDDIETLAAMANAGDRLAEVVARVCGEGHPALAAWRSVSGSSEPRKENS